MSDKQVTGRIRGLPLAAVLAAGIGLSGCSGKPPEKPSGAVRPVLTMTAVSSRQVPAAVYAGTVQSERETRLAFRTSGQIISREAGVGDSLRAGQAIMRLDPGDAGLAVISASASVAAAQATAETQATDLRRASGLLQEGFISQSEFDHQRTASAQAAAQLQSARAQRTGAQRQVGYTVLVAPYGGVISSLLAEVGATVSPGQPVAVIADPKRLEVAVSIPEDQVDLMRTAPALSISLWADHEVKFAGRLRTLSAVADAQTRTFDARITLVDPNQRVRLGQTAEVVVSRPEGQAAFRVPLTAVDQRDGAPRLWLLDPKGSKVFPRAVVLAGVDKDSALVSSGLRAGEQVVVSGVHILRAGQTVRPMPMTSGTGQ